MEEGLRDPTWAQYQQVRANAELKARQYAVPVETVMADVLREWGFNPYAPVPAGPQGDSGPLKTLSRWGSEGAAVPGRMLRAADRAGANLHQRVNQFEDRISQR
jgi:hypothetical protein